MRNYAGSALMLFVTMAAAVGCYTINLRVSGERAAVENLRNRLVADARDIRNLQAELRTRARFPEMQRWNDSVFQMSAPAAGQFLRSPVQLASYGAAPTAPAEPKPGVVYAVTAPAAMAPPSVTIVQAAYRPAVENAVQPAVQSVAPRAMPETARLIRAGYTVPSRAAPLADVAPATTLTVTPAPVRAATSQRTVSAAAPRLAALEAPRTAPRAAKPVAAKPVAAKRVATPPALKFEADADAGNGPIDLLPQGGQ